MYRSPFLDLLEPLLPGFAERADRHDREGSFPFENFAELRDAGYLRLTLPKADGGLSGSLLDFLSCQEALAHADGSTALAVNMHLMTVGIAAEARPWPPHLYERIARGVAEQGHLINSVAAEKELGSPQGGGLPRTTARLENGEWVVNGRKTYTSLAPLLHYHVTLCAIEGTSDPPEVAQILIERGTPGLTMIETWDTMAMRATGSHDVVFEDVRVPEENLLNRRALGEKDPRGGSNTAWFALSVGAVYTGIGRAARDYAVQFARERIPTGLGKPIGELPTVRSRLAQMDIRLFSARALLDEVAGQWMTESERRDDLLPRVAAAKILATNSAIEVTDLALRVVGGESLFMRNPLQRYARDVRAGLYNPPLDDRGYDMIARAALQQKPSTPPLTE